MVETYKRKNTVKITGKDASVVDNDAVYTREYIHPLLQIYNAAGDKVISDEAGLAEQLEATMVKESISISEMVDIINKGLVAKYSVPPRTALRKELIAEGKVIVAAGTAKPQTAQDIIVVD